MKILLTQFEINRVTITRRVFTNKRLVLDNTQVIYISFEKYRIHKNAFTKRGMKLL